MQHTSDILYKMYTHTHTRTHTHTHLEQPELSQSRFRQSLKTFYLVSGTKEQCDSHPNSLNAF